MAIEPGVINTIKRYIDMCNEKNIHINKAILFGSYARGTAHKYSDIDLLLVSDNFTDDTLTNWKMLAPITASLFDIQPHPYPTKYFQHGDPFLKEIMKEGIEIN